MKKLFILLILFVIGCEENATEPSTEPTDNFIFDLNITDSSGEPLADTEFWVRYRKLCSFGAGYEGCVDNLSRVSRTMPTTSIGVKIGLESFNSLLVYNLNNEIVDTLVYGILQENSSGYTFTLDCTDCEPSYKAGVKVFKYVLESSDLETGQVIFRDMKYMVLINGAIDVSQLATAGFTDVNGNFQSSNKLWFPTLYDLPSIPQTDDDGNDLGYFNLSSILSDSIEVRVKVSDTIYTSRHKIIDGINNLEVVIAEDLNSSNYITNEYKTSLKRSNYHSINQSNRILSSTDEIIPHSGFSLSQNYPNPFN